MTQIYLQLAWVQLKHTVDKGFYKQSLRFETKKQAWNKNPHFKNVATSELKLMSVNAGSWNIQVECSGVPG